MLDTPDAAPVSRGALMPLTTLTTLTYVRISGASLTAELEEGEWAREPGRSCCTDAHTAPAQQTCVCFKKKLTCEKAQTAQ